MIRTSINDLSSVDFSGGFETTANALTFMCFLLAKHQDVQEKVYREIIDNIEVLLDQIMFSNGDLNIFLFSYGENQSGVGFIKFQSWVYFLEIALSICAVRLCPTFTQLKASQKLGITLYAVHPTFMKSTHGC